MRLSAPAPPAPVLAAENVRVAYPGAGPVVDGVSFRIDAGEFVGVVGPNGGGKTTLLRAALGLVPVADGAFRWWGRPLGRDARPRIAYVPQNVVHVDPRFPATVEEVVLLGRVRKRGLFRRLNARDRELARQALAETGMLDRAKARIGDLSGGQRQRVFLAKAIASEPDALVLDEPTTGVDPSARSGFYGLLRHLNREHRMTMILVSHDSTALYRNAGRILALNRHLVFDGTPDAFEAQGGEALAYGSQEDVDCHMPDDAEAEHVRA